VPENPKTTFHDEKRITETFNANNSSVVKIIICQCSVTKHHEVFSFLPKEKKDNKRLPASGW
jgi:hypothetical protein